jgi:hypothetical protein
MTEKILRPCRYTRQNELNMGNMHVFPAGALPPCIMRGEIELVWNPRDFLGGSWRTNTN